MNVWIVQDENSVDAIVGMQTQVVHLGNFIAAHLVCGFFNLPIVHVLYIQCELALN